MLSFIAIVLLVALFGNLFKFAIKATWGISKIIVTLIIFPLVLFGFVIAGFSVLVFPVLIVLGIVYLVKLINA